MKMMTSATNCWLLIKSIETSVLCQLVSDPLFILQGLRTAMKLEKVTFGQIINVWYFKQVKAAWACSNFFRCDIFSMCQTYFRLDQWNNLFSVTDGSCAMVGGVSRSVPSSPGERSDKFGQEEGSQSCLDGATEIRFQNKVVSIWGLKSGLNL